MRYVLTGSFTGAFVLNVILVYLVREAALRWEFVDRPHGRKDHGRTVALGGGIGIWASASAPLLAAGLAAVLLENRPDLLDLPDALRPVISDARAQLPKLLGVLAGGAAVTALGLWDDTKGLSPHGKLLGQTLIALGVSCVPGLRATVFVHAPWVHVAVTACWLVLMMNSFNLLDNMDGQTSVVSFLTGGALLVLALQTGQFFVAGMLLCLLGAVLGFLLFNLPPASIFMGDAGSMFVGYMLAMATILCSFINDATPVVHEVMFPLVLPLIIFAVPLYDSLSVMAIRFHKGKPVLQGDRNHFSHRLMRLGMSDRMVLFTVGCTVLATSLGATIPYGSGLWKATAPAVQALAVILVIIQLEWVSRNGPGRAEG